MGCISFPSIFLLFIMCIFIFAGEQLLIMMLPHDLRVEVQLEGQISIITYYNHCAIA